MSQYDEELIEYLEVALQNVSCNAEAKFNKDVTKELLFAIMSMVGDLSFELGIKEDDYLHLSKSFFQKPINLQELN